MTNEEMEGKFEFILKQQESFSDNLLQISYTLKDVSDRQDRLQARQDKFQSQLEETVGAALGLAQVAGSQTKSIEELREAQKEVTAAVKELVASQEHTDARLDALINSQIRSDEVLDELRKGQARSDEVLDELRKARARSDEVIDELRKGQARSDGRIDVLMETTAKANERQARADERLNEFIATVERFIRESRNGRNGNS